MKTLRHAGLLIPVCCLLSSAAFGATHLAGTEGEIRSLTGSLVAGDTLLIAPGTYTFSTSSWWPTDLSGGADDPIVIMPQSDSVRIVGDMLQNVVNITRCSYLVIKGLEITCSGRYGGVNGYDLREGNHHLTIEDGDIHDVTGVAIACHYDASYLAIRHCHIHDLPNGLTGIYFGQHDGSVSIHHCVFLNNWIHDCPNSYGMQIKRACYANRIEDNVIHTVSPSRAGIMCYKTDRPGVEDNNVIRGNVVWGTSEAITVVGGVDVENNVVFKSHDGIHTQNYDGWGLENLRIRNNTVYGTTGPCYHLPDWNTAGGEMVFMNNAAYQDNLSQPAISAPQGPGNALVSNNHYYGTCSFPAGVLRGSPPSLEFLQPGIRPGEVDLYPRVGSGLVDGGTLVAGVPGFDFNLGARPYGEDCDVGAYEWSGPSNPGWRIVAGFKEFAVATSVAPPEASAPGRFMVAPNPFASFTSVPGQETARFALFDAGGRNVGTYPGNRIGEGLPAGIYFLVPLDRHGRAVRIVKPH